MKTAHVIKYGTYTPAAKQAVYRLDPPYCGEKIVFVSGVNKPLVHEVMMFASDEDGNVNDWCELECVRDTTTHSDLFDLIGYSIVDET